MLSGMLHPDARDLFFETADEPKNQPLELLIYVFLPDLLRDCIGEARIRLLFRDVLHSKVCILTNDLFLSSENLFPTSPSVALTAATSCIKRTSLVIISLGEDLFVVQVQKGSLEVMRRTQSIAGRLWNIHSKTGALPLIELDDIQHHTPVPFFATNTKQAILSPVLHEFALMLRLVIEGWVESRQGSESGVDNRVCFGGTEAPLHRQLVGSDASSIVELKMDKIWNWDDKAATALVRGRQVRFDVEEFLVQEGTRRMLQSGINP